MADYIRRDIVLKIINTVNDTGGFAGYADYCVLFDEIDTMPAADVQPVDRWISFKDKQPQEGGFYLTYYAEHICVSQWFPSKNWYNEHGGNVTNMVEYWQPLPEPPKQRNG